MPSVFVIKGIKMTFPVSCLMWRHVPSLRSQDCLTWMSVSCRCPLASGPFLWLSKDFRLCNSVIPYSFEKTKYKLAIYFFFLSCNSEFASHNFIFLAVVALYLKVWIFLLEFYILFMFFQNNDVIVTFSLFRHHRKASLFLAIMSWHLAILNFFFPQNCRFINSAFISWNSGFISHNIFILFFLRVIATLSLNSDSELCVNNLAITSKISNQLYKTLVI